MLILWRLVHTFGFLFWFAGLIGTTIGQASARRAADVEARRGAWSTVRRFQIWEILGLVLTPLGGLFLAVTIYGHVFRGSPAFVHIKLLLVIIAAVLNVVVILQRRKADALLRAGDQMAFGNALRRIGMLEGMATVMLPAAIFVVMVLKYGG